MCSSFEHTHLCTTHKRERERYLLEGGTPVWGLVFYFLYILYKGSFCWVFFPVRVSQDKSLCSFCGCACLSFSDVLAYGYVVMMLNVIRYDITIKNLTWYQSHPERSLCAAETVLQLQLLKIRVSCSKTLRY